MVFKPPTFSEAIMVELRKDDIARGYYGKRKEAFLKWLEQSNEPSNEPSSEAPPSEAPSSEAPTKRERSLSEDRKTKRQKTD